MTRQELGKLTKKELMSIAKSLEMTGYSQLLKEELINAIHQALKKTPEGLSSKSAGIKQSAHKASISKDSQKMKKASSVASKPGQKKKSVDRKKNPSFLSQNAKTTKATEKDTVGKVNFVLEPSVNIGKEKQRQPIHPDMVSQTISTKFSLESPMNPSLGISDKKEEPVDVLPEYYGETKIIMMIRDPFWAYVYWEIDPKVKQTVGLGMENEDKSLFLRVYDITDVQFNGKNAHHFFDIRINDYASSWYVNLPASNRTYCVDLGYLDDNGELVLIARSNQADTPRDGMSEYIDEEWMTADAKFHEIYRMSGGFRLEQIYSSQDIAKAQSGQFLESLYSGSLPSSDEVPVPKKEKGFWLNIQTDLIIYGATEPDATLTIKGHEVQLRPDGTFTLRLTLPDGQQDIPVQVVDKHGEMKRKITPVIQKQTL